VTQALIEISVSDYDNTWDMPLSRRRWADFLAAAAMRGIAEPMAVDQALAAFIATSGQAGAAAPTEPRPAMTWWHVVVAGIALFAWFTFNSLVVGRY
jgi:hypothetical protein